MDKHEIMRKVGQLQENIIDLKRHIISVEKKIKQLTFLKEGLSNFQKSFIASQERRLQGLDMLCNILGQNRFVENYFDSMEEIIRGGEYKFVYNEIGVVMSNVDFEIARQIEKINDLEINISSINNKICYWKSQMSVLEE